MLFQQETKCCGKLNAGGRTLEYIIEYKKVKNINLRIKPNGEVYVSASKRVPLKAIEQFVESKAEFIFKAIEKYSNRVAPNRYFSDEEICNTINSLCERAYPYFEKYGVKYPQIKFKKLKSRWGSCMPTKGVLTFNTNLKYAPLECVWYVVLHEFTHFLQPNHSQKFYAELEKVCPGWKTLRAALKEISI